LIPFAQIIFGFSAEIGLKVEGCTIYFSNPPQFLHLLEAFQRGCDGRHVFPIELRFENLFFFFHSLKTFSLYLHRRLAKHQAADILTKMLNLKLRPMTNLG